MIIAVDWDIKKQTEPKKNQNHQLLITLQPFYETIYLLFFEKWFIHVA